MTLRLAREAGRDIDAMLTSSQQRFGETARRHYQALIKAAQLAITDIDPPANRAAPELGDAYRLYHLRASRSDTSETPVKQPRHFIIYRRDARNDVVVVRILHDASDLSSRLESRS